LAIYSQKNNINNIILLKRREREKWRKKDIWIFTNDIRDITKLQ